MALHVDRVGNAFPDVGAGRLAALQLGERGQPLLPQQGLGADGHAVARQGLEAAARTAYLILDTETMDEATCLETLLTAVRARIAPVG